MIVFALLLVAACSEDNVKYKKYDGAPLNIAVVGESPDIDNELINFIDFQMKEVGANTVSNEYDSIFVMPDEFEEASKDKYVQLYKELTIPIFFIDSSKRALPFVREGMNYETAPEINNPYFATGYLYTGGERDRADKWQISLYNDVRNENNIQAAYALIFSKIEEL
ncbi:hypothetical protein [Halobacillus sp. H74]|uniref:hypothetical protein n=1 Tax=Halobacillus sp. H74 TaxID=3457436 RepID=UPI003FCC773B